MWVWKKARQCSCKGGFWKKKKNKKKQANVVCCVQISGWKGSRWRGNMTRLTMVMEKKRKYGHLYRQTNSKRTCFYESWCMWMCHTSSCERREGGLERGCGQGGSRSDPPWVHSRRVDEDAVERAPGPEGGYSDNANPKSWEPEGDGMTLTRQWTLHLGGEDRQALILHFKTLPLPGEESVPRTIYGFTM